MSAPWIALASAISLTTVQKTVLQVLAATQERSVLDSIDVTFNSVAATAVPATVQVMVQTTAGAGATTQTPSKQDQTSGTPTVTALKGVWATTEPTYSDVLREWYIAPTSGQVVQLPLGREIISAVNGRLAVVITPTAAVSATVLMAGTCS